ncbi:MAG: acetyl-CoA carboxylase biotin carboxyl carrier protein subunit [Fimbriimonadaceae bacterium]
MESGESVATKLADLMEEFGLETASINCDGVKVAFSRLAEAPASAQQAAAPEKQSATKEPAVKPLDSGVTVDSPTSGIFYSRPSPGAKAFVEPGETVQVGDVIGIIEAMKVFNEITSTANGTVTEVVAQDGQLVNPGDPLIRLS